MVQLLLVLLILAGLGGAGYEFYLQQQAQAEYVQKRQVYAPQIARLTQQNQQLQEDDDRAARELAQPH